MSADESERVENFLANWIDANITRASQMPDGDAPTMQHRYLTDAVAAGILLDDVNEHWETAEIRIHQAFHRKRSAK